MTTNELISILSKRENAQVFIQCGFNRFAIDTVQIFDNEILLITEEDANNSEPPKRAA